MLTCLVLMVSFLSVLSGNLKEHLSQNPNAFLPTANLVAIPTAHKSLNEGPNGKKSSPDPHRAPIAVVGHSLL